MKRTWENAYRTDSYFALIALFTGILVLSYGRASAAINDSGALRMTGTSPTLAYPTSSDTRFFWDPAARHFQAGRSISSTGYSYSFVFGENLHEIWGTHAIAMGRNIYTDGTTAPVMLGSHVSTASGTGPVAIGYDNRATGQGATAIGSGNRANGVGSLALGRSSVVTLTSGSSPAYVIGYGLTAAKANTFVVGKFNFRGSTTAGTYSFVVGDGTGTSSRRDAFWIDSSGNVYARGNFYADNGTTLIGAGGGGSLYTSGNMNIGTSSSNPVRFLTNATERMRITETGNVGIGTGDPTSRLQVSGDVFITGNGNISFGSIGQGIRFANNDTTKISMGNTSDFRFGRVTASSIKSTVSSASGHGWTWGITGQTPIAGLSNTGRLTIAGGVEAGFFSEGAPMSLAVGDFVKANGEAAVALGSGSFASGDYSIAVGQSTATGLSTVAFGSATATGNGSVAIGRQAGVVFPVGSDSTAFAIGHGVTASQTDVFVVGRRNDKGRSPGDNMAFVVGIGQGSARADGLRLDKQGNLWVAGTVSMQPQGDIPMGVFQ